MKSLDEHNSDVMNLNRIVSKPWAGVECPKCGAEMYYSNPSMTLCSYPPKRDVACSECEFTGYKTL